LKHTIESGPGNRRLRLLTCVATIQATETRCPCCKSAL